MNVAVAKIDGSRTASDAFALARDRLPGSGAIVEKRQRAYDVFARQGLPHRRIEDWKYTDLRALMRDVMPIASAPDQAALTRAASALKRHAIDGFRLMVLVDGAIAPELSDMAALDKGLTIRTLRDVIDGKDGKLIDRVFGEPPADAIIALNTAMMTDGVLIDVAADAAIERPLHIVHVASGAAAAATFTRSLLTLGRNARATMVESFIAADGAKAYQSYDATTIEIGDGAKLEHVRLIEDTRDAFNIASATITVGRDATYNTFGMVTGALVSRYQAVISIAGEGAHVATNGVNLLNGRQHADTTLFMDHAVPHCASREVFRAVVDDRGHSVFQGRIIVRPHAQKTDAKMMTRALLLSEDAEADNKPELEIFADDVTCGHGATTGALDDSLLFYLRARGLSEKQAQALLIQAFVGEAIESIVDDRLRDFAIATAERWLEARA